MVNQLATCDIQVFMQYITPELHNDTAYLQYSKSPYIEYLGGRGLASRSL